MTNLIARQRQRGLVVVISVLVVVSAFWALHIVQSQPFKTYMREVQLRRTLGGIEPPPGATVVIITSNNDQGLTYAAGVYSSDLDFAKVKSHYLVEFARRGFTYKGDTVNDSQVQVMNFCSPDYQATLFRLRESSRRQYIVTMDWKTAPC